MKHSHHYTNKYPRPSELRWSLRLRHDRARATTVPCPPGRRRQHRQWIPRTFKTRQESGFRRRPSVPEHRNKIFHTSRQQRRRQQGGGAAHAVSLCRRGQTSKSRRHRRFEQLSVIEHSSIVRFLDRKFQGKCSLCFYRHNG